MSFPKECEYCGMWRKNSRDRPCLNGLSAKEKMKQREKCPIDQECIIMYEGS